MREDSQLACPISLLKDKDKERNIASTQQQYELILQMENELVLGVLLCNSGGYRTLRCYLHTQKPCNRRAQDSIHMLMRKKCLSNT